MATAQSPSAEEPPKDTPSPASDKDRFLAALEAKKGKSGYGSENHLSGGSTAQGKSSKAGGKREFRRKSG